MSAKTADSRARAIETAAELFQRQGYAATGLSQIIEESGSPKGSFYFNFPGGKQQLAEAALALAATYDPFVLRELKVYGFTPDAAMARVWYEKARDLGSPAAPRRLEMLTQGTGTR